MDHHAGGIDIGDFEVETFMESQAAGIDGRKIGIILGGFDLGQNASGFFDAKNGRESSFILGSEDAEDVPVALEDVFVEEAYAAIADPHSIGRPVINVLSVEEIVLEFLLRDQVGGFAVELTEHANGAGVGLLSPFSFSIELKGLDRSVIPFCFHDTSPFAIMRDSPFQRRGVEVSYLTEGYRAYGMDSHENFRKVYKSRNLPRSGLLEPEVGTDRPKSGSCSIFRYTLTEV